MSRCDFNKVQLCNFIEIVLRHGCSRINLLHIFRTPYPKNTFRKKMKQVHIIVKFQI